MRFLVELLGCVAMTRRSVSGSSTTRVLSRSIFDSSRLVHLAKKRLRARKLGVWLGRSKTFEVPKSVILNGKRRPIRAPNDAFTRLAFLELLIADCYRLNDFAQPVHTVLDIGANVGFFCLAARHAYPHATIHAYEPNPDLEKYLGAQAAIAECDYFMEAVGRDDGLAELDFSDHPGLTRSRMTPTGTIRTVAFRRAIERLGGTVDLVKADCEGAEWQFLRDHDAWKHVRNVTMEYHLIDEEGARFHDDIRRALTDLGFTVKDQDPFHDSTGLIFASREDRSPVRPRHVL